VIQMKRRQKRANSQETTAPHKSISEFDQKITQPFAEHLRELRQRIYYVVIAVALVGGATYAVQQKVVNILIRPAHGQHFIYTSVGGGIDFLFRICIYTGLVVATPVIVYNLLEFLAPVMTKGSKRFIVSISFVSTFLAIAGVAFGYFIGLPAALHFLFHQFTTVQIKPLVTIQSYLSFVIAYMLGSALIFQLPLILISINRIKPLKPSSLLHYERWVILAAFILSGLMNPSPNMFSQLIVAGPFIITYQLGILFIAVINRSKKSKKVTRPALNQVEHQPSPAQQLADVYSRPILAVDSVPTPPASFDMQFPGQKKSPSLAHATKSQAPSIKPSTAAIHLRPSRTSYYRAKTIQANRRQFIDFMPSASTSSRPLTPEA
jgi:sec-independent protein translocase protein TatC